jgi:hypothetical protein
MPTSTSPTTLPPITTLNDLDCFLLDSSLLEGTELREAISLVNRIVCSSTLETPIKQYVKRSELALKRTTSENVLLQKENAKYRELLQAHKERKKGKHIAIKGKYVFNTQEILELVEKAEAEASKGKAKKRQTIKATTSEIEEEEEEDIEEDISESESDCIIVASSR